MGTMGQDISRMPMIPNWRSGITIIKNRDNGIPIQSGRQGGKTQ